MKQINDDTKLSVVIISYKQAKYIREAIDSVLMQKVNFKYELILADDCSQDGTLEIMREYEKKYPDIIRVLERKKNLGASNNHIDACTNTIGKYITKLEGDDYWIDKNKLQRQIDFLDNNTDYYAVAHLQEGRNLNNEIKGYFPKKIEKDFAIENVDDFLKNEKLFSCSTVVHYNFYKNKHELEEYIELSKFDPVIGDAQMNTFLCNLGKVYVFASAMMVYRIRNNDGNSNFNSSHSINEIEYRYMNIYTKMEKYYNDKYKFFNKIKNNYTLGVAYDICNLNFKDIKNFNKSCPKKYIWKIILLFPITCIMILIKRFTGHN